MIHPISHKRLSGFTIVELLIVIVVIGILASITIVAYAGVQAKARDTVRVDSIGQIRSALEYYRIDNGYYPSAINSGASNEGDLYPGNGWEISSITTSTWLNRLSKYLPAGTSFDPINDGDSYFYYFFYTNNAGMCGASTPNCYKLAIANLDSLDGTKISGVYTGSSDPWRSSSATRAVWMGSY